METKTYLPSNLCNSSDGSDSSDSSDGSDSCDSSDSSDSSDGSDQKTFFNNKPFFSHKKKLFFSYIFFLIKVILFTKKCFLNSKAQIVLQLKKSNCDDTQKLKLW